MIRFIEVRCCDAHLIGYLPMIHAPQIGRTYVFVLDQMSTPWWKGATRPATLAFECAMVDDGPASYPALKSRDYPLAQIKQIKGFQSAVLRSEPVL
jgi:hypothetical protein